MADPLLPTSYINGLVGDSEEDYDPELLAELQREIERHEQVHFTFPEFIYIYTILKFRF